MKYSLDKLQSREESERFEFKRFESTDDSKRFAKHLVGFANRHGGELALGLTDSGGIQGKSIDYDQLMQTITNIAYSRCSPQVRFDDEYLQLSAGDILILEIFPREEIPHAVVERSEGTITNRDYWIRTKNSTRRVSDMELSRLFSTALDSDFSTEFEAWTILSADEYRPPPINLPDSVDNYRKLFNWIKIDSNSEGSNLISSLSQELFPFSLMMSLNKYHYATWDVEIRSTAVPFGHSSLLRRKMPKMVGERFLEQNRDVKKIKTGPKNIHVSGFDEILLSEYTQISDLIKSIQFHTLPDTEFFVEYSVDVPDNDESTRFVKYNIRIRRQDEFEIVISNAGVASGRGFPARHPIMDVAADNKFKCLKLLEIQNKWEYTEIHTIFEANFAFPDRHSADIRLNERYAERIWHIIQEEYSIEKFLKSLPNTELYKINHKIDLIVESLFE